MNSTQDEIIYFVELLCNFSVEFHENKFSRLNHIMFTKYLQIISDKDVVDVATF